MEVKELNGDGGPVIMGERRSEWLNKYKGMQEEALWKFIRLYINSKIP